MPGRTAAIITALEELEAAQINLGLYTTNVTAELLRDAVERRGLACMDTDIEDELRVLRDVGEVIEWRPGRFRSRIAETVRILRLLRQRLWDKPFTESPLLVEDIRVEFRQRRRPQRAAVKVADALPPEIPSEVANAFRAAIDFDTFSGFQSRALQQILARARHGNAEDDAFIIAGDTGAGKTEAFLFPILLDIASEPPDLRNQPGVRAVLVYPRIRLARNQLTRLLRYTSSLSQAGGQHITIGIQNSDIPSDASKIEGKRWARRLAGTRTQYQVQLLESCTRAGCEGYYWVFADDPAIDTGCPTLTCDTCQHEVATLHITQAALSICTPDLLIITDVSLSQWLAREKYTHLWGLWQGAVRSTPPRFLVLDEVHLYERLKGAHIARLIKRFQARVRLAARQRGDSLNPVVIGVSATLHDEARFLAKLMDVDPQDTARYQHLHVIKPLAEELEATEGRERYIFIYPRRLSPTPNNPEYRVNDQTAAIQIVMAAMHNLKRDADWRGLAFFDSINDLRQFRHNYDGRTRSASVREFPPANQEELWRIRTDRKSARHLGRSTGRCDCDGRSQEGTLHECAHFRAGDCWVFSKIHGWNEQLRVADSVYAGSAGQLDAADLIPTSPSLEVGYDDDDIHLVYQHKAPSNAASFIQRRGRAGRDPDDSPVIITLLWPYRRDDAFYFFRPEALYDPAFDDAPLNAANFNVQRTHALLAFFDLLACLRRQQVNGIADDPRILDFTEAGRQDIAPSPELVQGFTWLADPRRPGYQRLVIKHRQTKESIWLSGKPIAEGWVRELDGKLVLKGWLAMQKGLTDQVLKAAWQRIGASGDLSIYLNLADIASDAFRRHRSYPFLTPLSDSLPSAVKQFGTRDWHASQSPYELNWLQSYRHIDWMLQGSDDATTLAVHYPLAQGSRGASDDVPGESAVEVTFGLTELLPGNVSYRLREPGAIHWTPIPADGQSTFRYPMQDDTDNEGNVIGRSYISEYLPEVADITSRPDSIFGVPRYLDDRFPSLPFMSLRRLRAEEFGAPDRQISDTWVFVPDDPSSQEGRAVERRQLGGSLPAESFSISRRSSARASSVIIPYIAGARHVMQRQLLPPLNTLFGAIDGFLDEGSSMLGYTRVFYEMQIDVKGERHNDSRTLYRHFYPHEPERDDDGRAKPILVGYAIETQGVRFQVNPDILRETVRAIVEDEELRLHLRRSFAIYQMAPIASVWGLFVKRLLDVAAVAIDYWLHEVAPAGEGAPRLLDAAIDQDPLVDYYRRSRVVQRAEVTQLRQTLATVEDFFPRLNDVITSSFQDSVKFREFVESVVLHSVASLLKNLVARLGGIGSDDLVAYADLPLLDQVDRSAYPRILIMDTVEGGSGGIAQAFARLDVTDNEGSLWWTLQSEMGYCPIGTGEAFVRAVLRQASGDQVRSTHALATAEALSALLNNLDLQSPAAEGIQALGRVIFSEIEASDPTEGERLIPALILHELFALQSQLEGQVPGGVSREFVARRAALLPRERQPQHIAALRVALERTGVASDDLDHELSLQLNALFNAACADGCPVCLSAGSDIEHYYLAPHLNSRRALHKLRQVLFTTTAHGSCLAELAGTIREGDIIEVLGNPGQLAERPKPSLGLAVVPQPSPDGQINRATAVVLDSKGLTDLVGDSRGWEQRWGGEEHRRIQLPDGRRVRSRAEYIVATMLDHNGIAFEIEPALPYRSAEGTTRYIHPDFYLYEHNLYIEYWGRDDPEYIESRRYKEEVYQQRGIVPISIEKDEVDGGAFMQKILAHIDAR